MSKQIQGLKVMRSQIMQCVVPGPSWSQQWKISSETFKRTSRLSLEKIATELPPSSSSHEIKDNHHLQCRSYRLRLKTRKTFFLSSCLNPKALLDALSYHLPKASSMVEDTLTTIRMTAEFS